MHSEHFNYRLLGPEDLEGYHEEGYLVIRDILTPSGLAGMREQAMAAWSAEKAAFDPSLTWLENSLLVNIHHRSPLIRNYYFEGPLTEIAGQIIGPNIKGATSQLTFKMAGNTKPFGWHQDYGYGELDPYNAMTTLTALDHADTENGCLWLIPGSHRQGQLSVDQSPEQKKNNKEIIVEADTTKAIPIHMNAGDVLVFNCWMLHRSDGNFSRDRDRRILFLRYADADAVEVYNGRRPRLGRLLKGKTVFEEVRSFEQDI